MSNRDRIAELYYGEVLDPAARERCRRRVHWMCAQVRGPRVLDVGCSQGIASILLGREGFRVTGVDIEEGALDSARARLQSEDAEMDVRFERVDGTAMPFEDGHFHSAILGEILEHLLQPERLLAEVARVVAPGGTIVVTTPFGLHEHHDHKRTFYLSDFLELVSPLFETLSLEFLDKTILFCGRRRGTRERSGPEAVSLPVLGAMEAQLEHLERAHAEQRERWKRARERLEEERRSLRETLSAETERAQRAESVRDVTRELLSGQEKREQEREEALRSALQSSSAAGAASELRKEEAARARERAEDIESRLEQRSAELASERRRLGELETHTASLQRNLEERSNALAAAERRAAELESRNATLESEGDELRSRCTEARHEGEELRAEIRSLEDARAEAASRAGELEGQLASVRRERDDAARRLRELDERARGLERAYEELRESRARAPVPAPDEETTRALRLLRTECEELHAELTDLKASRSYRWVSRLNGLRDRIGLRDPHRSLSAPERASAPESSAASTDAAASPEPSGAPGRGAEARGRVRTAAILDEFSRAAFEPECELRTFRPDDWSARLEASEAQLLLAESAWRGNDGAWQYRVPKYPRNMGSELAEVTDYCRRNGIPTVFWNKEDPVHFERFIDAARRFDVVFTTDDQCVERYREQLGHDRVHPLPFGAQPRLHNPASEEPRRGGVCFAGTYYASRHDQRRDDMELLLAPALDFGLHIFDRRHGYVGKDADQFAFPEKYQRAIQGRLEYDEMVRAYKRYRLFLNVNSVTDSGTMFSRRVFELLACGTPVVSTYSRAIEETLGGDVVHFTSSESDTRAHLEKLLRDDEYWMRCSVRGVRRVLDAHTYSHRFARVLDAVGIAAPPQRGIAVLASCETRAELKRLGENLMVQHERPAALHVVSPLDRAEIASALGGRDAPRVHPPSPAGYARCAADLRADGSPAVAVMRPDALYGPYYLMDHRHAWSYLDADWLGRHSHYREHEPGEARLENPGHENSNVAGVASASLGFRSDAADPATLRKILSTYWFQTPSGRTHSSHRFGFVALAGAALSDRSRFARLLEV